MKKLSAICVFLSALVAVSVTPTFANQVFHQHNSNAIWFENWGQMFNGTLDVVAPDGRHFRVEAAAGTPVFQLDPTNVIDGTYSYEVTAAKPEKVKIINPQNNGRGENASNEMNEAFKMNGQFTVLRGIIVEPEDVTEDSN